jgi:hypothetical protein
MNNYIKNTLLLIVSQLIFFGCSEDKLELAPRDKLSTDVVFNSLESAEGAALGLYERGRAPYTDLNIAIYKQMYTDLMKPWTGMVDQAGTQALATFQNFTANSDLIRNIWNIYYRGLFLANTIIENIDLVSVDQSVAADVSRKNAVLGEAYYFRAYFHLNLVEYWENIILSNKVFTSEELKSLNLSSREDVYSLIVDDLTSAVDLLPEASEVPNRGRVSKGVAKHLLSLAFMDIGSYNLSGFSDPFGKAADLAEEVINDPAYLLISESLLSEIFTPDIEHTEAIFVWQFNTGAPPVSEDFQQRHWMACMFAPYYDRVNGVKRSFEQGARPWGRMVVSDYYWTLFEDDDPRLEAWHKRFWIYDVNNEDDPIPAGVNIGDTVTADNVVDVIGIGMEAVEPTTIKFWDYGERGRTLDDADALTNVIQFRLGEAYLISAEANMMAGNTSLGQQRLDELRARSGRASIPLNIDNILDEHARELGQEGRRYPMIKRLGILRERVAIGSSQVGNNMQAHHVRWPIPLAEVQLLGLEQNAGYE